MNQNDEKISVICENVIQDVYFDDGPTAIANLNVLDTSAVVFKVSLSCCFYEQLLTILKW